MNGKNQEKKWIPMAVTSTLMFSALLGTAGMASASELDKPASATVNNQQADQTAQVPLKNHGQMVSETAQSLIGGPEKGAQVRAAAHNKDLAETGETQQKDEASIAQQHSAMKQDAENKENGSIKVSDAAKQYDAAVDQWAQSNYKEVAKDYRSLIDSYQTYIADWFANHHTSTTEPTNSANQTATINETTKPAAGNETSLGAPQDTAASAEKPATTVDTAKVTGDKPANVADTAKATNDKPANVADTAKATGDKAATAVDTAKATVAKPVNSAETAIQETNDTTQNAVQDTQDENVKDQSQLSLYDKLVQYYQKLADAYQSFASILK